MKAISFSWDATTFYSDNNNYENDEEADKQILLMMWQLFSATIYTPWKDLIMNQTKYFETLE